MGDNGPLWTSPLIRHACVRWPVPVREEAARNAWGTEDEPLPAKPESASSVESPPDGFTARGLVDAILAQAAPDEWQPVERVAGRLLEILAFYEADHLTKEQFLMDIRRAAEPHALRSAVRALAAASNDAWLATEILRSDSGERSPALSSSLPREPSFASHFM